MALLCSSTFILVSLSLIGEKEDSSMTSFQHLLQHFMYFRKGNIERLTKRDECRLMARYLRESHKRNPQQAISLITQLKQFATLPLLLADFLEGKRNGPCDLSTPELTLAQTLAHDVLCSGEPIITKAWYDEEARLEKIYKYRSNHSNIIDEENYDDN